MKKTFRLKKRSVKKSKGGMLPAGLLTQIKSKIDNSLATIPEGVEESKHEDNYVEESKQEGVEESKHEGVEESKHEDNNVEESKQQLKSKLENCKKELEISKRFAEKEKERAENLQKKLYDLENSASDLRNELTNNASTKTLDEIDEEIKKAIEKCLENEMDDCPELEKLDLEKKSHPEYQERLNAQRKAWDDIQKSDNEKALQIMRGFVPSNILKTSLKDLKDKLLEKIGNERLAQKLARHIWYKKILWLIRMPKNMLKKLSPAEFKIKYSQQGLDIVELRAVYYSLPDKFENDALGLKKEWKNNLRLKLENYVMRDEYNQLTSGETRNSVYENVTPPFDPTFEDIDWEVDANESKNKEERKAPKRFAQLRKK
tara:strand:- start:36 stop:1157 length:1122 start_codon:yes stop_codon:yes gene_type:complete